MTIIEFIATFAGGFTFGAVVMALHKVPHDDEDDGRLGWKIQEGVPPRELQLGKHMEEHALCLCLYCAGSGRLSKENLSLTCPACMGSGFRY
jgi:hypothetical protein